MLIDLSKPNLGVDVALDVMAVVHCVWYWQGGTERGQWKRAAPGTRDDLRRSGYVAHDGDTRIGPPEGSPTLDELREVLRLR
jgi:hypothetical protein